MEKVKKAQMGALIRKGVQGAAKAAVKAVTKAKPAKTLAQKVMDKKLSKDITLASPRLPLAEKKLMERKALQRKQIEDSYKKNGGPVKKMQAGGKLSVSSPDSLYKRIDAQIKKESTNKANLNNKFKQKQDSLKSEFQKGLIKMKSKTKMQAGGVMKPTKRVGPVDPNGAYTKVQERTLAGKKAPKVPLVKDKQLGATRMKKGGVIKKK